MFPAFHVYISSFLAEGILAGMSPMTEGIFKVPHGKFILYHKMVCVEFLWTICLLES